MGRHETHAVVRDHDQCGLVPEPGRPEPVNEVPNGKVYPGDCLIDLWAVWAVGMAL